jgi:endonuclease/exonuclease/phosphatase (EEP) superfamily protein YafD
MIKLSRAKKPKTKKIKPKRPLKHVLKSVREVLKISPVDEAESVWQWGEAGLTAVPREFNIAVWNIWKSSGGELFLREYQNLCAGNHFLLCQEALLTLKGLAQFAPNGFMASHGATYRRRDGLRDGVMTVARVGPESEVIRVLCKSPEPLLKTPKATLISYFRIEGSKRRLCVVNTHSTLIRTPSKAVGELEQIIDVIAHHEGPIIYAGDFNTFAAAYISEVDRALSSIGLERVRFEVDPRAATAALDQIYVRGLTVVNASVDTGYVHSDHFPILATLRISG